MNTIKLFLFLLTYQGYQIKQGKYLQFFVFVVLTAGFSVVGAYLDDQAILGDLLSKNQIVGIQGKLSIHTSKAITHINLDGEEIYPKPQRMDLNTPQLPYPYREVEISNIAYAMIYDFLKMNTDGKVMIYGFYLNNRSGDFYPIKMLNSAGVDYSHDSINALLEQRKSGLSRLKLKFCFFVLSIIGLMVFGIRIIHKDKEEIALACICAKQTK